MLRAYLSLTLIAPLATVLAGPFILYRVAVRDWSSSLLWFYLFSDLAGSDSGRRWLSWQCGAVVFILGINPLLAAAIELFRFEMTGKVPMPRNHALHPTRDPAHVALPLQAACVKCG
jgi:hypothetical protein